jgi:adenosylhomocysteine nucleosidase
VKARAPMRRACVVGFGVLVALLTSCATAGQRGTHGAVTSRAAHTRDTTPRIAIVSAFDAELARLRDSARITGTRVINGRTHWLGELGGHDVVLMLSGYSMVNAAMTTQTLLDHFVVTQLVFSGIAGGVNPSLAVGDVTVPQQWGNYQEHVFARETGSGWEHNGMAGEFANFGMMFPRGESVVARADRPDSLVRRFWFPVDSASLATARRAAERVQLARCTTTGECLGHAPRIVLGGNGVSGPTFVDNAAYREYVWRTFMADALDMETAAVALVAHQNGVPYIAFRSLSDLAGGGAGGNEVRTFGRLAADNSAAVVLAYLRALPPRRTR